MYHPVSSSSFQLDFHGAGFHGIPQVPADPELRDPWLLCACAVDRAKKGDFEQIPLLLDLYGKTGDFEIDSMCTGFLSVAGTGFCFAQIVEMVRKETDLSRTLSLCGTMSVRGELSYVPIFLDKFLAHQTSGDAQLLPAYIRDLIGNPPYSSEDDDFQYVILDQYQHLVDRFDSNQVLVFRGELYSVSWLARFILERLSEPVSFQVQWRINFEAATGIDCTSWYRDGALSPLAVAAIVEEFLESGAGQYEDGVRYFFGHRVPD